MKIQEQIMYLLRAAKDYVIIFLSILLGIIMFVGIIAAGAAFTPVVIFIIFCLSIIGMLSK